MPRPASHAGSQPGHRQRHAQGVVAGRPPEVLSHHAQRATCLFDGLRDRGESITQHDEIGARLGQRNRAATSKRSVCLSEYRAVIEPVAHHRNAAPRGLLLLKHAQLVFRHAVAPYAADANTRRRLPLTAVARSPESNWSPPDAAATASAATASFASARRSSANMKVAIQPCSSARCTCTDVECSDCTTQKAPEPMRTWRMVLSIRPLRCSHPSMPCPDVLLRLRHGSQVERRKTGIAAFHAFTNAREAGCNDRARPKQPRVRARASPGRTPRPAIDPRSSLGTSTRERAGLVKHHRCRPQAPAPSKACSGCSPPRLPPSQRARAARASRPVIGERQRARTGHDQHRDPATMSALAGIDMPPRARLASAAAASTAQQKRPRRTVGQLRTASRGLWSEALSINATICANRVSRPTDSTRTRTVDVRLWLPASTRAPHSRGTGRDSPRQHRLAGIAVSPSRSRCRPVQERLSPGSTLTTSPTAADAPKHADSKVPLGAQALRRCRAAGSSLLRAPPQFGRVAALRATGP